MFAWSSLCPRSGVPFILRSAIYRPSVRIATANPICYGLLFSPSLFVPWLVSGQATILCDVYTLSPVASSHPPLLLNMYVLFSLGFGKIRLAGHALTLTLRSFVDFCLFLRCFDFLWPSSCSLCLVGATVARLIANESTG